jgi:hypothetical protein
MKNNVSYYKHMKLSLRKGMVVPPALMASVVLGLLAVTGMYLLPSNTSDTAIMLTPSTFVSKPGDTFTVQILTTSEIPVNAFKGMVQFNEGVLTVESIDYNISLADLWAETPWYEDGAGTIGFAGGTTRPGGFTGTDTLLTVTFKAHAAGNGNLVLQDTLVLMHDGFGTEAPLKNYVDTLFVVAANEPPINTPAVRVTHETKSVADVLVLSSLPNPDLNNDGKVDLTDISLFLLLLPTNNLKGDFNNDGKVNTADLSILLQARTN